MLKGLVKSLHLTLPLLLHDQGSRADDHDRVDVLTSLKLAEDQTSLNGFADADTIRNQEPWSIRTNKSENRAELVSDEVDACCVQRVQRGRARMLDVACRKHGTTLVRRELLRDDVFQVRSNKLRCEERTGLAVQQDRVLDLRTRRIDGDDGTALFRLRFQSNQLAGFECFWLGHRNLLSDQT